MAKDAVPMYKMQGDFSIDIGPKKVALYKGNYLVSIKFSCI